MQTFRYGWRTFVLLGVAAGILLSHSKGYPEDSSSLAKQAILDREEYLIANINRVPDDIAKKEQSLISGEPLTPIFEPKRKRLPDAFNYAQPAAFQPNPITEQNYTRPNMPAALNPMGPPPKKVVEPPKLPPPPPKLKDDEQAAIEKLKEQREMEREKLNQPLVALSPFLVWVKEHQKEAEELAQQSTQKYAQKPDTVKADDSEGDPFLSIRFPYRGLEASGSAAIYSTPEK